MPNIDIVSYSGPKPLNSLSNHLPGLTLTNRLQATGHVVHGYGLSSIVLAMASPVILKTSLSSHLPQAKFLMGILPISL